ncbi:hypothetical protein V6N13_043911 [Hibiscus sabdariffa]|uniref:Uncharacterized protein n=1 Tax=Hibiscus sabdariffa TaxID=183260 RepID=A0ABR2RGM3_9ROSI
MQLSWWVPQTSKKEGNLKNVKAFSPVSLYSGGPASSLASTYLTFSVAEFQSPAHLFDSDSVGIKDIGYKLKALKSE